MVILALVDQTAIEGRLVSDISELQFVEKLHAVTAVEKAEDILETEEVDMFIFDGTIDQGQGMVYLKRLKDMDKYKLTWTILIADHYKDCDQVIENYNRGLYHRYIQKPYNDDQLITMIKDLSSIRIVETTEENRLRIRRKSMDFFFDYDDILFVETVEKMAYVFTKTGKHKIGRITLGELECRLEQERFVRIHRSYIVNTDYIDYIRKQNNQNLIKVKHHDHMIPIGRTYRSVIGLN